MARLNAKAEQLVDKLKSRTAPLATLAAAEKLKLESAKWLKRGDNSGTLAPNALAAVFRTSMGAAATAEGKDPAERIVFVVTDITVPQFDPTSPDAKRVNDALRDAMANDLYSQYVARVETDLGVSVNQGALSQALGATPAN
jgi:peptidyl-prolyl cis-trans isomerase D